MPPNVQNARDDLGDLAELLMVEGLNAQLASRQRLLVHERLERDRGEVAHRDLRKEIREFTVCRDSSPLV